MIKIIGASFMIVGLFIIVYRQYIRFRGRTIILFSIEPYCIWETIRGWGFMDINVNIVIKMVCVK